MPTTAHIIYIPIVLLLGIVIGFVLGGRAARDAEVSRALAEVDKAARRAARKKAQATDDDGGATT